MNFPMNYRWLLPEIYLHLNAKYPTSHIKSCAKFSSVKLKNHVRVLLIISPTKSEYAGGIAMKSARTFRLISSLFFGSHIQ